MVAMPTLLPRQCTHQKALARRSRTVGHGRGDCACRAVAALLLERASSLRACRERVTALRCFYRSVMWARRRGHAGATLCVIARSPGRPAAWSLGPLSHSPGRPGDRSPRRPRPGRPGRATGRPVARARPVCPVALSPCRPVARSPSRLVTRSGCPVARSQDCLPITDFR